MRVLGLLAFALGGTAALSSPLSSPPVVSSIQANWPAPALVTLYLETTALEAPDELFPFLAFLTSHPSAFRGLPVPLLPPSYAVAAQYERAGLNPVFAPEELLQANETLAILEHAASRSLLFRSRGLREAITVAMAQREASVRIEGSRTVWEAREKEVEGWEKADEGAEQRRTATQREGNDSCESWIDVAGRKVCSTQEFWEVVGQEQKEEKTPIKLPSGLPSPDRPHAYPLDHLSPPGRNAHLPRFVLYGSPSSPSFQTLFNFLYSLSAPKAVPITGKGSTSSSPNGIKSAKHMAAPHPPRLQFILRWKPSTVRSAKGEIIEKPKLVLTGYGAALDIKKSDYLAIDDRLATATATRVSERANHTEHLLEIEGSFAPKMEPMRKSDMPELSLRTAQFILDAAKPFEAFRELTSAFPRLASQLPALVPEPSAHLLHEVSMNQMSSPMLTLRPGFWLNGLLLSEDEVDPFTLLRLMRKERKYLADLVSLSDRMTGQDARRILIDGSPKSKSQANRNVMTAEALGELYDATDRNEGGEVILWWNNLEKDKRYKSWGKSVRDLLRPTYPGAMTLIARNLNNVVFLLDLTQPNAIALITDSIKQFVARGIPVRFGVVPVVGEANEAIETKIAQVVWYLVDALGRAPTMEFLSILAEAAGPAPVSEDVLVKLYTSLASENSHIDGGPLASYEEIQYGIGKKATSQLSRVSKTREYLKRLGVKLLSGEQTGKTSLGSFLMNGAFFPIDEDFTHNLQRSLGLHTQFLAQEAYANSLTDKHDASTYFADLPSTHKRRNSYIYPSETNPLRFVNLVEAFKGIDPVYVKNDYVEGVSGVWDEDGNDIEDSPVIVTIFVVAELNGDDGLALAKAALKLAEKNTRVRVSFLHNPIESYETHPWTFSSVIWLLHHYKSFSEIIPIELLAWHDLELTVAGPLPKDGREWSSENPLKAALANGIEGSQAVKAQQWWEELQWFAHKLGFQPGESGLVINGRVIGPLPEGSFELADFQALVDYELEKRVENVAEAVYNTSLPFERLTRFEQSHLINIASSVVGTASLPDPSSGIFGAGSTERRRDYLSLLGNHSAVFDKSERGAFYEIAVVVDPATELAQRWAPILETLSSLALAHVHVYLNPTFHLDEIPIKRFYEFSFSPALQFDELTGAEIQPGIRFDNVPEDVLLTFAADVPNAWLAFPKTSVHDLDNIRLADLPAASKERGVEAVLELESLVVEGHVRDMPSSKPPRGLQLDLLKAGKEGEVVDASIVMANLGYVQLKASPGPFRLSIRPGRSSEVFELESVGGDGWKSGDVARVGDSLVVSTLEGLTIYPRVRRKEGHEVAELLDEGAAAKWLRKKEGEGLFEKIKNIIPFFTPTKPTELIPTAKRADINVFTVASGLLYERMAFLMMVSVMKHTESTVKFWFISNFLSPSFKAFIPYLAKEYDFDYELVTYKWPHWLRAQKEKQRTIWGYKILFLDVLFPLELDRVIFVDSDQIVRTDLKELIDMDLQGAPYAYAPMGQSRPEMEGFRFWNSGYWKNHLQGRPYHISALYLVDLDRFRQIAAGDRLRQQYQGLSADPNSLSNLDQDLPNNMQSMIPIHTLDKSWLWCETWCADEELAEAKTIDLCNNPLTKEEKLKRAKRLIPEWSVYDDEVAALARRVAEQSADASAFATKADELEQAQQQAKERETFLQEEEEKKGDAASSAGERVDHVKDEL
ncbi:hypothetical protein JCM8547_004161 [Rhodosporidiobolus lusitaniae]